MGLKSTPRTSKTSRKAALAQLSSEQTRLAVDILIRANELDKAKVIADGGKDPGAYVILAAGYAGKQKFSEAITFYRKALKLDSSFSQARQGAVAVLLYQAAQLAGEKSWSQAEDCLREAQKIDPENSSLKRYQGAVEGALLLEGISFDHLDTMIPNLENVLKANLARPELAHQLAILYHRQAIINEEKRKNLKDTTSWERAFGYWAMAVESDEYWQRWSESRQAAYETPIPPEKNHELRYETIKSRVRDIHHQYIQAYSEAHQSADITRHQKLRGMWTLEMAAARALHETLVFLEKKRKAHNVVVVCGPTLWRVFEILPAVEKAAQDALKLDRSFKPAQDVLDAIQPTGLAKTLIDEGVLDEALALLEEHIKAHPKDASAKAVAATALMSKAEALAGTNLEAAIDLCQKAKKYGVPESEVEQFLGQAIMNKANEAENSGNLEEAERILRLGLKYSPNSRLLKDRFASVMNRQVKVMIESTIDNKPEPDRVVAVIQRGMDILRDADKLAGPNHPEIQNHLKQLQGMIEQLRGAMIAPQVNAAIDRANKAIQNFRPGSNYQTTLNEINAALSALETAARQAPNEPVIKKHLEDLRGVRTNISQAEAGYLNGRAVQLVNEATQEASRGNRYSVINKLQEAENLLVRAQELDRYDNTIRQNLDQVRTLRRAVGN